MEHSNWTILGAGAIGLLYASWLKNQSTVLLKETSELGEQPLPGFLDFKIEKQNQISTHTIYCAKTNQAKTIDKLLICTKAHQTQEAVSNLDIKSNATLVLMQNGMGNHIWLQEKFPHANILLATSTHGAYRKSAQHIVHAGTGNTYIGNLNQNHNLAKVVASELSTLDETLIVDEQIEKRLWMKLAINCAINPLTAIYQCKNGELLDNGEKQQQLTRVCNEINQVLISKAMLGAEESCLNTVIKVAQDTAKNFSSMYQDVHNNRQSEIDFIQGYLCQQAQQLKIKVPENYKLYQAIKKIEASY